MRRSVPQSSFKAVSQIGCTIRFIKKPTEKVIIKAVSIDPFLINQVKNATEQVQLAAIKKNHMFCDISKIQPNKFNSSPPELLTITNLSLDKFLSTKKELSISII